MIVVPAVHRARARASTPGLTTYAQNVHWEPEGAYTGEVSPPMLLELGVGGALVGHSERRQYFGETDIGVARRAQAALEAGLGVIACVGETQEERDAGDTETVLRVQVEAIRDACGPHERLVLAYEPVWAIGTGLHGDAGARAGGARVHQVAARPAGALRRLGQARQRGRSCSPQPDVDGALVGGASLDIDSFAAICEAAARSRS